MTAAVRSVWSTLPADRWNTSADNSALDTGPDSKRLSEFNAPESMATPYTGLQDRTGVC